MLSVTIKDTGVLDILEQIRQRVQHLRPAMSLIGEVVQGSVEQNFMEQGRPTRWRDLSPVTKALRARRGKWPGQILRVSGAMSRIRHQAQDDRVEVSSGMPYGITHHFGARKGQFGTVIANVRAHLRRTRSGKESMVKAHPRRMVLPWGNIPARPFMMVQREDWDDMRDVLARFLMDARKN